MLQARGVMAMDGGTSSDPYCKLTLGKEKARTRILNNTLNPKWREAFDLDWYLTRDMLHVTPYLTRDGAVGTRSWMTSSTSRCSTTTWAARMTGPNIFFMYFHLPKSS